ncbi:Vacuolar protein, partial [Spiromyces aspiralis]
FRIAAAPYGGPIALLRDNQQLLEADPDQNIDSSVHIYSANGSEIGKIECDGINIVGMYWTNKEELVCIQEDGQVRIFTLVGKSTTFTLGDEARERGIIDCKFWNNGLVAMMSNYQLITVDNFREPKPHNLAEYSFDESPRSWAIIPPHLTLSHHVEVLLSIKSTILVVDAFLNQGPFSHIAVSPNGRLVALCTETGLIQVISSNFERSFSESTPLTTPPDSAVCSYCGQDWDVSENRNVIPIRCGTDAVVASYDNFAVLVGPFGDILSFEYDSKIYLVQEMDGVRVFTKDLHDFLQKVPESTRNVFQIGSTSPAALLYNAYEYLQNRSPKADEIVRSIKHDLALAVDTCIAAAGNEPLLEFQQMLLRAASFGKSFITVYNGDKLVDMCRHIRLLNTLSAYELSVPVTLVQFQSLPLEDWIDRLVNRNQHFLALKICDYLDEARDKIRVSSEEEDKLYLTIMSKLSSVPGISFVEIAETANAHGYSRLAVKLLKHEPKAGNQVPLLLSMNYAALALEEAINSGDADLVYFVILHLYKTQNLGDFFHLVSNNAVATHFFEKYCREQGATILEDFYFQNDAYNKSSELVLVENLHERDPNKLVANLRVVHRLLSKNKSYMFEASVTANGIRLLNEQQKLEHELEEPFVGLTLNQTISKCILKGRPNKANKLRNDFNMSEKTFYWIKLHALVQRRDWVELDKFARVKKPPIGFQPFVEECIKAFQYTESAKYIAKCDIKLQPQLYIRIGRLHDAFQASIAAKDVEAMRAIAAQTQDESLRLEVQSYLSGSRR